MSKYETTRICDCEKSANGLGISGRACDCGYGLTHTIITADEPPELWGDAPSRFWLAANDDRGPLEAAQDGVEPWWLRMALDAATAAVVAVLLLLAILAVTGFGWWLSGSRFAGGVLGITAGAVMGVCAITEIWLDWKVNDDGE